MQFVVVKPVEEHAAAICIFVNIDNTYSKTNEPMVWNKPSNEQLEKYQKGCKLSTLFNSKKRRTVLNESTRQVPKVPEKILNNISPMSEMIKMENKYVREREESERCRLEEEQNHKAFLEFLYGFQHESDNFQVYHFYH